MDLLTPAAEVLRLAKERGATISTAESCTGGLIFATLTELAGSSAVMDRGFITYSNQAKCDMLGVDPALIESHGAVSEEVAKAMAEGALLASGSNLSIAVTGVAGPGASQAKPEGLVHFGLGIKDAKTRNLAKEFGPIGRTNVRAQTTAQALMLLTAALNDMPKL